MSMVQESTPISPSEGERQALTEMECLLESGSFVSHGSKLVDQRGEMIELTESVFASLREIVHHLAHGKAIAIVPVNQELTTQEAADILNVSRPFLVKLLEQGEIPFTRTGSHRRIRFDDLIAYKRHRDAERRRGLARLTQMSQEMGMYDE